MGMNFEKFEQQEAHEQGGVWVDIAPGFSMKLARVGNQKYDQYLKQLWRGKRSTLRHDVDEMAVAMDQDNVIKAMARHVILDWKGLTESDDDGNEVNVAYSEQKAIELMTRSYKFYRIVLEAGSEAANFAAEEQADSVGNSVPASTGT